MAVKDSPSIAKPMCNEDSRSNEKRPGVFEDILEEVGSAGVAQILTITFSVLVETTVCYSLFYFVFEGANPGFSCMHVPVGTENSTLDPVYNITKDECPDAGYRCANLTYEDDLTSIVTEVSLLFCGNILYKRNKQWRNHGF